MKKIIIILLFAVSCFGQIQNLQPFNLNLDSTCTNAWGMKGDYTSIFPIEKDFVRITGIEINARRTTGEYVHIPIDSLILINGEDMFNVWITGQYKRFLAEYKPKRFLGIVLSKPTFEDFIMWLDKK